MFAVRKSILPAALMLALVLGSATPASARPGIWVYLSEGASFSVSLVNLTDHNLLISDNSFGLYCQQHSIESYCLGSQSHPFEGNGALQLDPYRTAIWKSYKAYMSDGDFAWSGHFYVKPEGMDAWTVSVNMHSENAHNTFLHPRPGKGTWIYLSVNNDVWDPYSATEIFFNPGSMVYLPAWNYGVWSTIVPIGPTMPSKYSWMYNVMTVSGTDFAASLYSPDNQRVTLVFRQTFWDGVQGDDYVGWPLDFVDDNAHSVPQP
jgi:hypothetical protein